MSVSAASPSVVSTPPAPAGAQDSAPVPRAQPGSLMVGIPPKGDDTIGTELDFFHKEPSLQKFKEVLGDAVSTLAPAGMNDFASKMIKAESRPPADFEKINAELKAANGKPIGTNALKTLDEALKIVGEGGKQQAAERAA